MQKRKIFAILITGVMLLGIGLSVYMQMRGPFLDETYVRDVITEAREKYDIPAVSVSVFRSDEILFTISDGVRAAETPDEVTVDDYYHIGSCSKTILAYIAGNLVEEGIIAWDTKYFALMPELLDDSLPAYAAITLQDLLTCRAGIQPYTSGEETYPDLTDSEDNKLDFAKTLFSLEPFAKQSASGEFSYLYSNASYSLAAYMVERASGMSYHDLVRVYVEEALGIDVQYGWPYEISEDQPLGHLTNEDGTVQVMTPDVGYELNPLIEAAGDISMRTEDFARFFQTHLSGLSGQGAALSQDTFSYMDNLYAEKDGISLGAFNNTMLGHEYVYMDGTAGVFYARGVVIPDSDFGFVILMNAGNAEAVEYITIQLAKAEFNWWWMVWS
jgi:D-alanyl-D-alanine carboxypeptidase